MNLVVRVGDACTRIGKIRGVSCKQIQGFVGAKCKNANKAGA